MRVRVTQNAVSSIERELLAAMEMSQNKIETRQEFLNRLLLESDSLSDEVWGTLSEPAKDWLVSETQTYNVGLDVREFEVTKETIEAVEQTISLTPVNVVPIEEPEPEPEPVEEPESKQDELSTQEAIALFKEEGITPQDVAQAAAEQGVAHHKKVASIKKKVSKKKAPVKKVTKKAPIKKAPAKKVVAKKAPVKTSLSDNPTSAKKGIKYLVRKNLAMDAWELTLYILVQNPDLSFKDFVKKFLKEKRANMTLERSLGYKYKDFQIMKKVMKRMELFETLEERDA